MKFSVKECCTANQILIAHIEFGLSIKPNREFVVYVLEHKFRQNFDDYFVALQQHNGSISRYSSAEPAQKHINNVIYDVCVEPSRAACSVFRQRTNTCSLLSDEVVRAHLNNSRCCSNGQRGHFVHSSK